MKKYKLINNLTGWFTFLIAAYTYLSTMEATASFWDCGEFISSAFKLEVGHPPGAPFFMLLGNFFINLAGHNPTTAAIMVNTLSALASAFTILFLFWTITHLTAKIVIKNDEKNLSVSNILIVMGSGFVGALAYNFSDTFWFSAVEGEVYATSSLITALVFWAILKWENECDKKPATRWIILIAYLIGLSIGVHLLNLLAIPAIVFIVYFKKYQPTVRSFIGAIAISLVVLAIVMWGMIGGLVKVASWFELFFVNTVGLPFNSGIFIYLLFLLSLIIAGLIYTHKKQLPIINTIILSVAMIILGYSSYAGIVIRSLAEPPMDQNNPDNMFSLLYYLNREQYGDRPLFYGKYFNAPAEDIKKVSPFYAKNSKGKYDIVDYKSDYVYDKRFMTFFPRMYSDQQDHIEAYKQWGKIKGRSVKITNYNGNTEIRKVPTFAENLRFFFRYQIGFMYMRYFMWNFAGRQNDIQGHGNVIHGNWISGINFIDELRLGPQDELPDFLAKNKARNRYYLLPLLLGLLGLFFHYKKHPKDFFVVLLLFIMTGIAIVVYLNQTPFQPRERDYAYAGSFYAFTIWIGLGVTAIYSWIKSKKESVLKAVAVILICLIAVPSIMAKENWDDHDRSKRYTARDFACNYLNSCAPNAIIFTNGDNDTFPLWYAQEVEGVRTDIKVVNLSYLTADWYIEQCARKSYTAEPIPISMTPEKYRRGYNDVVPVVEEIKDYVDVKQVMQFVTSDNPRAKRPSLFERDKMTNYIPVKNLSLKVDKAKVLANGTVCKKDSALIVNEIRWRINDTYLLKNKLAIIDMLANFNWDRPIYYAITVSRDNYLNLEPYFQLEGLTYRIVPVINNEANQHTGRVATDIMFDNVMNKFKWGNIQDSTVYLDENNLRMLSNYRNNFALLADALYNEGKKDSCMQVINRCLELLPNNRVEYDYFMLPMLNVLYKIKQNDKANEIAKILSDIKMKELKYFFRLDKNKFKSIENEVRVNFYIMQEIIRLYNATNQSDKAKDIETSLNELIMSHSNLLN
jgi:hypothetical protein